MRWHLAPIILTSLLTPACADHGDEPETGENGRSIAGATLETMLLDSPVLRGSIVDGTGCNTLGDPVVQGNSITFILVDYIPRREGTGFARATCDFALEVPLPAGVTIALEDATYKGFADGSATRLQFFREYFFGGVFIGDRRFTIVDFSPAGVPTVIRDDSDDYESSFDFIAHDSVLDLGEPPCGEPAIWRVNTSVSVRNTSASSFSLIGFDTIDGNQYFATFEFGSPESCL